MNLEEELQQIAECDFLRIEDDLDRFGVRAVIVVGRVGHITAGIAYPGADDARAFAEKILDTPETPSRQNCALSGHRWLLACPIHRSSPGSDLPLKKGVEDLGGGGWT